MTIKEITKVKHLGVAIDQRLTWNDHIRQITCKATKVNTFLNRNLYQCPPIIKSYGKTYFGVLINSLGSTYINRLEAAQRSAARICYRDFSRYSSVTAMLLILIFPLFRVEPNYRCYIR